MSMKPYYERDGIVIYHGDAREVLPTLDVGGVDLVLTDPPYGVRQNTDNRRFTKGPRSHIANGGDGIGSANGLPVTGDTEPFDPSFLLQYGQYQVIWGWNNFPNLLPRGATLVWLKRNDAAFQSFLSDAELAWMSKGHGVYCRRDLSNNAIARQRTHPTQKPVSLMTWCLSFFPKAQTILDPFMGSGSTLVAAHQSGRRAIGIEIEERYAEIAATRLQQAVLPLQEAA